MHRLGMSAEEVLRAATCVNARIIGKAHELGAVAAGYFADLIAVAGDPTEDPGVLSEVPFVMKDGVVVKNASA
jgi:imidazolonepropionase-like amidohydrolase